MSQKEVQLATRLEAARAGSLHPEIYAQVVGATGGQAGSGSMPLSSSLSSGSRTDPQGASSIRSAFGPTGTKTSADSQLEYADPNQTIIIYDWDDTLCPSTCVKRLAQYDGKGRLTAKVDKETLSELTMLSDQVLPLLRRSLTMGKVVIVTNAKRPWVDISRGSFLPALKDVLEEIPVIYALELLRDDPPDPEPQPGQLLTATKARAMKAVVSEFYSRYPKQSWKNIVSIGDALFEHDAIRQVVQQRPMEKPCRTKTVKLLEGPTIAGMVVQLSIVENWLTKIVQMDNNIDIDLSASEETVANWVSLFDECH